MATVAAAGALTLALAACASSAGDGDETDAEEAEEASESSSTTEADSTTSEPEPSTTTSPTTAAPPTTLPSTDVAACADLDCEVTVTEGTQITTDGSHSITLLVVDHISPDFAQVTAHTPGATLQCGAVPDHDGDCTVAGDAIDDVRLTVTIVDGETAIVGLSR